MPGGLDKRDFPDSVWPGRVYSGCCGNDTGGGGRVGGCASFGPFPVPGPCSGSFSECVALNDIPRSTIVSSLPAVDIEFFLDLAFDGPLRRTWGGVEE